MSLCGVSAVFHCYKDSTLPFPTGDNLQMDPKDLISIRPKFKPNVQSRMMALRQFIFSRQKIFTVKIVSCQKCFPPKYFTDKIFSRQKCFPPKMFPVKNIFSSNKFLKFAPVVLKTIENIFLRVNLFK
jgi:hypothetical protein